MKAFMTYHFALKFQQICFMLDLETNEKIRLVRLTEILMTSLTKAVHAKKQNQAGLHYFTATLALRDCREELEASQVYDGEIKEKWEFIHARLEKVCTLIAKEQGGQLEMIG